VGSAQSRADSSRSSTVEHCDPDVVFTCGGFALTVALMVILRHEALNPSGPRQEGENGRRNSKTWNAGEREEERLSPGDKTAPRNRGQHTPTKERRRLVKMASN
jgi:hypothetical protein